MQTTNYHPNQLEIKHCSNNGYYNALDNLRIITPFYCGLQTVMDLYIADMF